METKSFIIKIIALKSIKELVLNLNTFILHTELNLKPEAFIDSYYILDTVYISD